ncbi:ATP-dependent RNA helicase RhlE [Algoriphagus alkaliphilus]|uniref:ATP-dependent RNA helicase RhlE n=1 Tax=Algoriphagus alkaliphilus TaxID=279824 RepID=A0A1G5VA49_9BACT|nr:DEAD/DEAH box helicase [Algoriphagus alkaliphilus]MBA4299317.1 ATP-dependent helicase [Cyclobacterium sp.]SDA42730.1 ATP-dependent RNA helicase RhlE [Algoriphagus alkaliphilus]
MNNTRNNTAPSKAGNADRRQVKKKKESTLDPKLFVKKAKPSGQAGFRTEKAFEDLNLNPRLLSNILAKGYETLTTIQEQSILPLLEGRDMMAISKTGSGKTAAFLIPIIEHALKDPRNYTALVVTPTRELALQIEEEFKSLVLGLQLYSATFIGGTNINSDYKQLERKLQVVVGTPGRLLDLAARKLLKLNQVNTLVLDEFDRMLDMGFVNDVKKLVNLIGKRDQTLLFSATLEPAQKQLISTLLQNPIEVIVENAGGTNENIEQQTIKVPEGAEKFDLLSGLFKSPEMDKVILFTETKRLADRLAKKLNQVGIAAGQIHGDKSQNFRNKMIEDFKKGNIRVLVATDVAARGIDVADVSHVINYQLPMTMDAYIHRIGRTGRAGKIGHAITFVN